MDIGFFQGSIKDENKPANIGQGPLLGKKM